MVSAVTTALTVFEQKNRGSKDSVDGLAKSIEKLVARSKSLLNLGSLDIQIADASGDAQALDLARRSQIFLIQGTKQRLDLELATLKTQLAQLKASREQKTVIGGIVGLLERGFLLTLGSIGVSLDGLGDAFERVVQELKDSNQPLGLFIKALEATGDAVKEFDEVDVGETQDELDAQEDYNNLLGESKQFELDILKIQNDRLKTQQKINAETQPIARGVIGLQTGIAPTGDTSIEPPDVLLTKTAKQLSDFELRAIQFRGTLDEIFNEGIAGSIGGFASSIGEALVSGENVLESGLKGLLRPLAALLNTLGDIAIATGLGVEAIKKSLESLGGLGAIAAGIAIKVLAGVVAGAVGGLARGTSTGGAGISGSAGQSSVGGPEFASDVGEQQVTFVIEGKTIVGVLNNYNNNRRRTSGGKVI